MSSSEKENENDPYQYWSIAGLLVGVILMLMGTDYQPNLLLAGLIIFSSAIVLTCIGTKFAKQNKKLDLILELIKKIDK